MRRSAVTKRRSSFTGMPPAVRPRCTWSPSFRAKWFSTRTVSSTHPEPDQLFQFFPLVGAVEARCYEHRDGRRIHARLHERADENGKDQSVRHRSCDVADQYTGALLCPGFLQERPRAFRREKRLSHSRLGQPEERHLCFPDDGDLQVIGQIKGQALSAVSHYHSHITPRRLRCLLSPCDHVHPTYQEKPFSPGRSRGVPRPSLRERCALFEAHRPAVKSGATRIRSARPEELLPLRRLSSPRS